MSEKPQTDDRRPVPRTASGFADAFAETVLGRNRMIASIAEVYARFGFEPLETPAVEYLDVLGKYLPEADQPDLGVFALRDDDDQWIALRYDLTAPLSRVYAQYAQQLPKPYRRYQIGPVWRREKPGPGRFRQFYQCDFDTVGAPGAAADAEVCAVLAAAFDALGLAGRYEIRVNNRKVLNGILERAGIFEPDRRTTVLRAVDKLDRLGLDGVRDLLGPGRKDPSGDFTRGAELASDQIDRIVGFVSAARENRRAVCDAFAALTEGSADGEAGVAELREIDALLTAMGLGDDAVVFDPSLVRGLAYYTGPVFEGVLTFETTDENGRAVSFGSVAGGGRYDDLVERFTGERVPATGASIGVDRLAAALRALAADGAEAEMGPVVVTVMDKSRLADYQAMATELRGAGIPAEIYLGGGGFRQQMKYADRRRSPAAVIAGEDEFAKGEISIKDLRLGSELAAGIAGREEWRKGRPAQQSVARTALIETIKRILSDD